MLLKKKMLLVSFTPSQITFRRGAVMRKRLFAFAVSAAASISAAISIAAVPEDYSGWV
jgi:hypothetical protein